MSASRCLEQAELLLRARNLQGAMEAYTSAERSGADPDVCSGGRWAISMLQGDHERAWRESDAIRERNSNDPHRFWLGEDFTQKRVILRCLHGFGDAVQFLRYVPLLRDKVAKLIVEVAPPMLELARMFDGVDDVVTWGPGAPSEPVEWDVQTEINELPYVFRTQAADLPLRTRYLNLPRDLISGVEAAAYEPGRLRVGVVWACGAWNPNRNLPCNLVEALIKTPECEFWNLQGGAARTQWLTFAAAANLHAADDCAANMAKLAATVSQLDLIITPDTLAAHIAGALGTRAWVLLEYAADWRWQHGRSDSPWYPSLRLFRQPRPGDWGSAFDSVSKTLHEFASEHASKQLVASHL